MSISLPANIELSGMEVSLINATSRKTILKQYLDTVKKDYQYIPAKGLEQLLQTINKVRKQINPKLQRDGILLTMVDNRTNFVKDISTLLRDTYGGKVKVFATDIPHSVRADAGREKVTFCLSASILHRCTLRPYSAYCILPWLLLRHLIASSLASGYIAR